MIGTHNVNGFAFSWKDYEKTTQSYQSEGVGGRHGCEMGRRAERHNLNLNHTTAKLDGTFFLDIFKLV